MVKCVRYRNLRKVFIVCCYRNPVLLVILICKAYLTNCFTFAMPFQPIDFLGLAQIPTVTLASLPPTVPPKVYLRSSADIQTKAWILRQSNWWWVAWLVLYTFQLSNLLSYRNSSRHVLFCSDYWAPGPRHQSCRVSLRCSWLFQLPLVLS